MPLTQIRDHTFMLQGITPQSVVLDLGANHGEFSHAMIARFGCRSVAVEANPALSRSIPPHQSLIVINAAVASDEGTRMFGIRGDNDEASSILRTDGENVVEAVRVPALTIEAILARHGLESADLLKMDIEGAELEALDACSDELLQRFPQVTIEFHDFNGMISHAAARQVVARFQRLGFDVFRMWMRSHGDTLFVNRRLASVGRTDRLWSGMVVRNWWWTKRFVKRKLGLSM